MHQLHASSQPVSHRRNSAADVKGRWDEMTRWVIFAHEGQRKQIDSDVLFFRRAFASVVGMSSFRKIKGILGKISSQWPATHACVGGGHGNAAHDSGATCDGAFAPFGMRGASDKLLLNASPFTNRSCRVILLVSDCAVGRDRHTSSQRAHLLHIISTFQFASVSRSKRSKIFSIQVKVGDGVYQLCRLAVAR